MSKKTFAISLIAGFGIAIAGSASAQAQQAPSGADLLKDPQGQDALNDLFNNRGNNPQAGLMQLIQRVSQGSVDPAAFQIQQRENIDAATVEFLKRRQAALQKSQPVQVAPAVQPLK
ncbi:MAG TPA: hypothetical protein VL134_11155 [Leptolyngbya sp.]|nr:hypothetical protein [Leptolyngbya sp.]